MELLDGEVFVFDGGEEVVILEVGLDGAYGFSSFVKRDAANLMIGRRVSFGELDLKLNF